MMRGDEAARQDMTQNKYLLQQAVENLYVVFADAILAVPALAPCDDLTPDEIAPLQTKPVRSLTSAELRVFVWNVYDFAQPIDLKHFWPRLCELAAFEALGDSFYSIFSKLRFADWRRWTIQEQAATERYAMALWQVMLNRHPLEHHPHNKHKGVIEVAECIRAFGNVIDNLSPYLAVWESQQSVEALRNLAIFANQEMNGFGKIFMIGDEVWHDREVQMTQVFEWMLTPTIKEKLTRGLALYADSTFAEELSGAIHYLQDARRIYYAARAN